MVCHTHFFHFFVDINSSNQLLSKTWITVDLSLCTSRSNFSVKLAEILKNLEFLENLLLTWKKCWSQQIWTMDRSFWIFLKVFICKNLCIKFQVNRMYISKVIGVAYFCPQPKCRGTRITDKIGPTMATSTTVTTYVSSCLMLSSKWAIKGSFTV